MKGIVEKLNKRKGISLIVLVITIIVIIILAAAIILNMSNNNPIESARKAKFQSDLRTLQEQLGLYISNQYMENRGSYNPAGDTTINDLIPDDYKEKVNIIGEKVKLIGDNTSEKEKEWANEIGITEYPLIPTGFKYKEGTVDSRICNI